MLSLLGIIFFTICLAKERRRQRPGGGGGPGGGGPGGGGSGGGGSGDDGPSSFNTTIYDNMDLLTLNLTINDTFYWGVKYIDNSTGERVAIDVGPYVIPAGCYPCSGANRCINIYRLVMCQNQPACNWEDNDPGYGCEALFENRTDAPTGYPSQGPTLLPTETNQTFAPSNIPTTINPTPSPTQVPTLNNTIAFGRTTWGEWGPLFSCPADSYVDGFRLRVEALVGKGFDDTALNTIEVHCSSNETGTSAEGDNGNWTQWKYCPEDSVATGAEFKSVPEQTTGGGPAGPDNIAGTDLNLRCSNFSVIYGNSGWNNGQWRSLDCPELMAISGIRTQVESNCSSSCTGLNQVHFTCSPATVGYFAETEAPTSASIGEPTAAQTTVTPTAYPNDGPVQSLAHLEVVFRLTGNLIQSQAEKLNVAIADVLNIEVSDVIVISALWRASSTRRRRRMSDGYWEVEVEIYADEQSDLENIKTQLEENDETIALVAAEMELKYGVDVTVKVGSIAVRDNSANPTEGGTGSLTIVIVLVCIGIVVLLGGLMYYRYYRSQKRKHVSRVSREIEDPWHEMGHTDTAAQGETELDKRGEISDDDGKAATIVRAGKAATVGEVELEETGHLLQEPSGEANKDQNGATL